MEGWIKLHRDIQETLYYKKSEHIHLWVHLLVRANHKGCDILFNGKKITLNPGQFITSRNKLSEETGIEESKIERILSCFKSEQQIEQQGKSKSRLITIINWDKYQKNEQQNEHEMNSKRTASEHRQECNNNNNEKKEYSTDSKIFLKPTEDEVLNEMCIKAKEKNLIFDCKKEAVKFWNYYESVGWCVGKKKMKSWRAALSGWVSRSVENGSFKVNLKNMTNEELQEHYRSLTEEEWIQIIKKNPNEKENLFLVNKKLYGKLCIFS